MMNEPVSNIMTKDVISLPPDAFLFEVKDLFKNKKMHHIPIVENERLVGLITTSDLLWLNKPFSEYDKIRVSEVMTSKLATLGPNAKVGTASEIFLQNLFHALPVVEEDDRLVGIVTTFDLLKYSYKKEYPGDNFPFE